MTWAGSSLRQIGSKNCELTPDTTRNCHGRSFVTSLGDRPPLHPHDRRSDGDKVETPWPGYLIGGAHPRATSWEDEQHDYRTNEIAINGNAALLPTRAGLLDAP